MLPKVHTPDEARKLLKIGRTRFFELLHQGKIKSLRNGRRYLIPESCLLDYIDSETAIQEKKGEETR